VFSVYLKKKHPELLTLRFGLPQQVKGTGGILSQLVEVHCPDKLLLHQGMLGPDTGGFLPMPAPPNPAQPQNPHSHLTRCQTSGVFPS